MIKKILIVSSFIFLILFLTNKIFFFKTGFLETISQNISYPFLYASNLITEPIKNFLQRKQNYQTIQNKNSKLKEKNETLKLENIKLKASLNYDSLSKDLLDFQHRYDLENSIFAKILAKNFSKEEHYFLINKGSRDGIQKDMVAIYKFQLLGRVTDVYSFHSKILLITDKSSKVAASANNTNSGGIIIGENKINSCNFAYVSHLAKIEPKDLIISNGQGLIFPEGFCLGKIKKFSTKDLYHVIQIKPLIDFTNLKFCLITNQEKMDSF